MNHGNSACLIVVRRRLLNNIDCITLFIHSCIRFRSSGDAKSAQVLEVILRVSIFQISVDHSYDNNNNTDDKHTG